MDDATGFTPTPGERPLTDSEKFGLVAAAAATILLFYVVAALAGALLGAVFLILFVAMLGAARVGMARVLRRAVKQHAELLGIVARSFWLSSATDYRITIVQADAPRLFALLEDLSARMGVAAPREVVVEMHANAWVRLKGYGQGSGRTSLGVGYDLLAALSECQVEAVLAHEMAHAKLVRRGLKRWLGKGLSRLATLSTRLAAHADAYHRQNYRSQLGELFAKCFDRIALRAARLVSTYSRQEEFEADRGAALVCGGAAMRAALMRLERAGVEVDRLPWNERRAQLQLGESFSTWLVGELDSSSQSPADVVPHAPDPYSTHPSLHDRLSALPTDGEMPLHSRAGIELLANPDDVAERLVAEIMRVSDTQERKDTKALARAARNGTAQVTASRTQWLGVLVIGLGLFPLVGALTNQSIVAIFATAAAAGAGGLLIVRGRYRDRYALPVPSFGTMTKPRPVDETVEQLTAVEDLAMTTLRQRVGPLRGRNAKLDAVVRECYGALEERDYLRARAAARLGIELNGKSVEAAVSYSIAGGGLGSRNQAEKNLPFIKRRTGLKTRDARWGTAWALIMVDAWEPAEGVLALLVEAEPHQPTFLSLLALAQVHRGKMQSAIRNATSACDADRSNSAILKLLIGALLTAGNVREGEARLMSIGEAAERDTDHVSSWFRLSLMQRRPDDAREWAARLRGLDVTGQWQFPIAAMFESARMEDDAVAHYTQALDAGHYPEARIGLARIASHRGDRETARRHLLAALDVETKPAPNSKGPLVIFNDVLASIVNLEDRRVMCTAWLAKFPPNAAPSQLADCSMLVYATDRTTAVQYVETIISAMQPAVARSDLSQPTWSEAPKERQPVRPVQRGAQRVI